jgi:hypothetical protein
MKTDINPILPNKSVETSRRPALALAARRQFGRPVPALPPLLAAVAHLGRSANMRGGSAIFVALTLTGCTDAIVTKRFESLDDATAQHAFERGWLPPLIPDSARGIVGTNNLDLNTGSGVFDYLPSERTPYLEGLIRSGASLRTEHGTDILTLTTNGSRWEIRLYGGVARVHWTVRPQ